MEPKTIEGVDKLENLARNFELALFNQSIVTSQYYRSISAIKQVTELQLNQSGTLPRDGYPETK